ncbi:MAG TPA: hypothetical protein DCQ93_10445 [Bacteroidetes bacterium]|nr:hypothetical protein [Bacteroidota bacterium]
MKKLFIILFALIAFTASSCSKKEKLSSQINKQIDSITHALSSGVNPDQLKRLTENVNAFAKSYSKDSLSARFLFELARIEQSTDKYSEAITDFSRIEKEFPQSSLVGQSIFSEGFIYANNLHDYDKAREKFQLYISKYGKEGEKMTNDAKIGIENLGLSVEEEFDKIMAHRDSLDKK